MNFERGLKDCSASQYHNAIFKAAAEELGLTVERVRHYGYALTTMPDATAERYQVETWALGEVLIHRKKPATLPGATGPPATGDDGGENSGDKKPASRLRKATCGCGHIIRLSLKTFSETTIRCESCGEAFQLA